MFVQIPKRQSLHEHPLHPSHLFDQILGLILLSHAFTDRIRPSFKLPIPSSLPPAHIWSLHSPLDLCQIHRKRDLNTSVIQTKWRDSPSYMLSQATSRVNFLLGCWYDLMTKSVNLMWRTTSMTCSLTNQWRIPNSELHYYLFLTSLGVLPSVRWLTIAGLFHRHQDASSSTTPSSRKI